MGEAMSSKDLTLDEIPNLDLETAERYREELLDEVNAIDAQLGSGPPQHGDATQLDDNEYHRWRRRAIDAKRHMMRNYRALKKHCADLTTKATIDRTKLDADDPHQLAHALTSLVHRLKSQGVEFDREEIDLIVAADYYVKRHPL